MKFTLELEGALHGRLAAYAARRTGTVSMAQVVREAITEKLDRDEDFERQKRDLLEAQRVAREKKGFKP